MIKIICVGKIKESFYREAINEYLKRLSKYTKIEIVELNDFNYDKEKTIKEESRLIINKLDNGYNILLDINGESLDSISFSSKLNDLLIDNHNINFIIGGSYGVSDELKNMVNYRLSFSKMTFPHQLFRVVLIEQIYRAFKIINNEEYHK
jgi:23S rRNA (pseudouridine1915-N3)-methyltransferase